MIALPELGLTLSPPLSTSHILFWLLLSGKLYFIDEFTVTRAFLRCTFGSKQGEMKLILNDLIWAKFQFSIFFCVCVCVIRISDSSFLACLQSYEGLAPRQEVANPSWKAVGGEFLQ